MMNNTTGAGPMDDNFTGFSGPIPNTYEIHRIAAPELLVVDRVITPVWYIIGIIGNPLSARIWLGRKVRSSNSSALYLGSIAIVQTISILLHVWVELQQAWGMQTYNRPVLCEVFMVLYITPQYLAPILILGFTFERYIAICHPFLKEQVCTVKRATTVIIAMSALAIVFGLFQAYVWAYDYPSGVCEIRKPTESFYTAWTWFSEMLVFVAVPLTVLLFNILVIREIKRINRFDVNMGRSNDANRGSNQTSTITLLSVSFYLICTLLPATIVYTIQLMVDPGDLRTPPHLWSSDSTWTPYLTYYHVRRVVEELCFSNYACYAIIYYITSNFYREQVQRFFCLRCKVHADKKKKKEKNSETYSVLTVVTDKANGTKDATPV